MDAGAHGAALASRAQPDGYTLFMGAVHHTIAPSMYPKLDYDLTQEIIPGLMDAKEMKVESRAMAAIIADAAITRERGPDEPMTPEERAVVDDPIGSTPPPPSSKRFRARCRDAQRSGSCSPRARSRR